MEKQVFGAAGTEVVIEAGSMARGAEISEP